MAFTKDNLMVEGDIEVIVSCDSSLDITQEQYNEYIKTLDESLLKFKDGEAPTKFVMRKNIPLKHIMRIENSKLKYSESTGEVVIGLGFMAEEVRASLKDILNPAYVPEDKAIKLKFTGDGLVDDRQMSAFVSAGIVKDLYQARNSYLERSANAGNLKKS